MNYIIYVLAALGIVFIVFLYWVGRIAIKAKNELASTPRNFNNSPELIKFIRNIYDCKIEHKVLMYGFVEFVELNNGALTNSEPTLDVDVALISKDGFKKVNTSCGDLKANLRKGDFVAILPIYNQRNNFWIFITVAKLNYQFQGKQRGFSVSEQYID